LGYAVILAAARFFARSDLHDRSERLLDSGMKPTLAKLRPARMIAATVLRMWNNGVEYDPGRTGLPSIHPKTTID
jgi:hypothetical protein